MRASLLIAVLVTAVLSSTVRSKPHIVFILQDDLGHYDVAFNGNTNNSFVTGNISSLAREGIILSHHYVHWHCSPTRRSFLTGRLPVHHHEQLSGIATDDIDLRYTTIAAKLKLAGYSTHWYGKGHTGYKSMAHLPTRRGFDRFTGFLSGSQSYTSHDRWEDEHPLQNDAEFVRPPPACLAELAALDRTETRRSAGSTDNADESDSKTEAGAAPELESHPEDAFGSADCKMILGPLTDTTFGGNVIRNMTVSDIAACRDACCAVNCSHLAFAAPACMLFSGHCTQIAQNGSVAQVHFHPSPAAPTPAPAPSCAGSYSTNLYGKLAVEAVEKHNVSTPLFLYFAIQAVHTPYDKVPGWPVSADAAGGSTYMGMLWDSDRYIGKIVAALKAKGMYDNTLIVYTADNGGTGAGINYPLRGEKHTNWEGGMRTAAFVSGGLIPAAVRGTASDVNFHIVDWYPTFCVLAGVDPRDDPPVPPLPVDPQNRSRNIYSDGGHGSYPGVDGVDIWDMLVRPAWYNRTSAHEYLVLSKEVVVKGALKLLVAQNYGWPAAPSNGWKDQTGQWVASPPAFQKSCGLPDLPGGLNGSAPGVPGRTPCLFDLDADVREQTDLAASRPADVSELWAYLNDTMLRTFCKGTDKGAKGTPGCNSSPPELLGKCDPQCAYKKWGNAGPQCGVPGC